MKPLSLLALLFLLINSSLLTANDGIDDIDFSGINNLPVIVSEEQQKEQIARDAKNFIEKEHKSLNQLFTDFFIIYQDLDANVPKASTLRKEGVLQELYLGLLTKLFRGSDTWGLDFITEESNFESGRKAFLTFIKGAPLDQNGINLLKAFVLSYKGNDDLLEEQIGIINALNDKVPTDFEYSAYDYKTVKTEGKTSFKYDSFEFDPKNTDIPEGIEEARAKSRIQNFPTLMQENLKGAKDQIERVHAMLKENFINPDKKINVTLLGTSGNGKTQFAKAMAIALFNDKDAMKKLTFTGKTGELSDYLRSSTGYVGSDEPTDFELWFRDRIEQDKGGIIVLDELLSFYGLSKEQIAQKVQTINELYDLLDERVVKIGNKVYDMSKFHVVITGNALQEAFQGLDDNPDIEKEINKIINRITKKDIINYFNEIGIDPPKLARFGEIFVNGPLARDQVREVSQFMLKDSLKTVDAKVKVKVDQAILDGIVSKLSTVELGMREVNIGLSQIVMSSVNGILFDIAEAKEIEAKLIDGKIFWYVDGEEVVLNSSILNKESGLEERVWSYKKDVTDTEKIRTPQFDDLEVKKEVKVEKLELYITSVHEVRGHWMVNTLITGRNEAQTISNIPTGNALGFVAPKQDEEIKASILTRLLKKNMMLEAGHRAPIHEGFYATGGGNANHKEGDIPTDDLNKIEKNLDHIFANHIFKQYTNVSDDETKNIFRAVLRNLIKESTDYVIANGNEIGFADGLMDMAMKDRFLVEEVIDAYAEKELAKLTVDHDEIFFLALNDGVKRLLSQYEGMPTKDALTRVEMLKNIIHKTFKETKSIREFDGAPEKLIQNLERLKDISLMDLEKFEKTKTSGCFALLGQLGKLFTTKK